MRTLLKALTLLLMWLVLHAFNVSGQLLSVDINKSQSPRSDDTAPGFVGWYDVGAGQTATHSYTNFTVVLDSITGLPVSTNVASIISCTLAQTYPAPGTNGGALLANWLNKNGNNTSSDPNAGYRLSGDGVWVNNTAVAQPYTNGGAFSLTISNLLAGVHTITTYHNNLWNTNFSYFTNGNGIMSRCVISANGVPVFTNTPSVFATNDAKCSFSFTRVTNSYDGQPVVINFDPDHSSYLDFVILNGFEIDRASAPGTTATAVFPLPGDEHVNANNDAALPGTFASGYTNVQWVPAALAISNYVYFGTNSNSVLNATTASPEFKLASAVLSITTNSMAVSNLNSRLTYYWRVDELDVVSGVTNLAKGNVWEFRTRHLSFPTAEGYGRFSRGGRGGVVMEVTNLLDYNAGQGEAVIPGSYRAAIEATGPRTVVFKVSGLIRLKATCVINSQNGYLTVAGQTAPGEGICLANWRAGMSSCTDVNMRFIRCRLGDAAHQAMDGIGLGNSTHSIIDHCSISWTMDEASSSRQSGGIGGGSAMITFQHNIISEPLQHSYHYNASDRTLYEQHAFAASISGEIGSYHHNLIAHSTDRNWSLAGGLDQSSHYAGSLDIRNNVIYNWIGRTTDGGVARCNYVSNYYRPYPSNPYATWLLKLDAINTNWGTEAYYFAGNVMEGKTYFTNNWMTGSFYNGATVQAQVQTNSEVFPSYVNSQTASNALKYVLSDVGCNRPLPDVIDQRVIGETLNVNTHYTGTNANPYVIFGVVQPASSPNYPGIIDSQTDVHDATNSPNYPWPAYNTYNVPIDSDHDGLPDWWELAKGLNPNSAAGDFSDSNGDPDGDGYTNLEDYLTWLAGIHLDCTRNSNVDVDLTQYARGFTNNSATFVVSNPTNGAVSLLAGGTVARFTPTASFYGIAGFQFRVTDGQGTALTNSVGIHVISYPQSHFTQTYSNGVPRFQFTGDAGYYFVHQYSDDMKTWITWTNSIGTGSPVAMPIPIYSTNMERLYRAVSVQ